MKRIFLLLVILLLVGCSRSGGIELPENLSEEEKSSLDEYLSDEIKTLNGVKYIVHPSKIRGGGPPKDGIPSIDNPKFQPMSEVDWIEDNELVLALTYKGEEKVYPLQILVWHEIVNDYVAGDPILITYCPLCGTGLAFSPILKGERVEFGTSGKLYNSNLVMYDRLTDTYWTQVEGQAIIGELAGTILDPISIDTLRWDLWKETHTDSLVLTKDTGHARNYGRDPYGGYYEDDFALYFPVEYSSDRIAAKTVIFGINVDGTYKAYKESDIGNFVDTVNGVEITVSSENGVITFFSGETEYVKERGFWFSWYAFHPDTLVYEP